MSEDCGMYFNKRDTGEDFHSAGLYLEVADLVSVANEYSMKDNSMTVKVLLYMWHEKTTLEVLLDCGTTHNFIDQRTVNKLSLGTQLLKQPLMVNNVDSTMNSEGNITHYCNL